MKERIYYEVEYLSELFRSKDGYRRTVVTADTNVYGKGTCVMVEHKNYGIFIGRVIDFNKDELEEDVDTNYRIIQRLDIDNYISAFEKEKKREQLRKEMEKQFAAIDKERKYEYYASIDENFKKIFEEYKSI